MESINVVVDDAWTSDYFSDDEGGMIFFPSSVQVSNTTVDSQTDHESETEKKTPSKGDTTDQQIGSSESLVPEMIRQFEEKSASKSLASDSSLQ